MKKVLFVLAICAQLFLVAQTSIKHHPAVTKWVAKEPFEQKVFIENKGQYELKEKASSSEILFGARLDGLQYYFTKNSIHIKRTAFVKRTEHEIEAEMKRLGIKEEKKDAKEEKEFLWKIVDEFHQIDFIGSGTGTEILPQSGVEQSYSFGIKKNSFQANGYKKLIYKNLYPNIDMEFYFPEDKQGFKYNFILHPGADPNQIQMQYPLQEKIKINGEGNIICRSVFGDFTDHAPIANENNTLKTIDCSFQLKNNNVSFTVAHYDITQDLIIDPWTTTPVFTGGNTSYDVDWDIGGNCYVYGGTYPYQVAKFNNVGTQLWTYTTAFAGSGYYGDFSVDRRTGSVYIVDGFNSVSGAEAYKLNTNGVPVAYYGGNSLFQEMWRMAFSRCTNEAVIAGGGTTNPSYAGAYLDTNLVGITPVNVLGSPTGLHDMWGVALDDFGSAYMSTAKTLIGSPGYDNMLYKVPLPSLSPIVWSTPTNYLFNEVSSVSYTGAGAGYCPNGFNGMSVSGTNLYTYDSYILKEWNAGTGAFINSTNVNGASANNMWWGGLTTDGCDHIFLGSLANVQEYDGSLNLVSTIPVTSTVYDVSLGKNNILYVCGSGFVSAINVSVPFCNSAVLNTGNSVTNANCSSAVGSATVTVSGGTAPYGINWSNGQTGTTATNLPPGTYTATITDNSCNPQQTQVIVTITGSPSFTLTPTSSAVNCNGGANGTATVTINGGTPTFTVNWSNGQTGTTASGLSGGSTYTVSVSDAAGCNNTATVTIAQPSVVSVTPSFTNTTCGNNNGAASVSASGGAGGYTYTWTPSGGNSANASSLPAGNYTCTVADANGCTKTTNLTIGNSSNPTASISSSSTVSCNGGNNGSATANPSGGSGGYTYTWTPGGGNSSTASNLPAGNYTCTVHDGSGCVTTTTVAITQPATGISAGIASSASVACNGASTGSVTANASGGTGAYTYTWSPSGGNTSSATNLPAGNYTCTVHDGNGCPATVSTIIGQPASPLNATSSFTPATCGQNNGAAAINASGGTSGYTYTWTPVGGNASTASGIPSGNYTCTIKDANGCISVNPLTITNANGPTVNLSSSNTVTCKGGNNGSAVVNPTGGTGPYTYTWSPSGGNTNTASNLPSGNYTCNVTDATGCISNTVVTISQPAAAVSATSSFTTAICGQNNGAASVTPSGGTGAYTYTWSPAGGNASSASGLPAGNYTCTIHDGNNCAFAANVTITNAGGPSAAVSSTSTVTCNGGNNGSATVNASGGTGPYTYTWSPIGGNSTTASNLPAGTYTCNVTDVNGCLTNTIVTINQASVLSPGISSSTSVTCNGGNNGTATATVSGGTGTYTYTWTPTGGNASTASGLNSGNYTCTIHDANGCATTTVVTIAQPTALNASISSTASVSCNGANTGAATVTVSGGTNAYTYTWSPSGGNNNSASGFSAGNYTCNVTDAHGCTTNTVAVINQAPVLNFTVSASTNINCNGGNNGSATVTATGGTGPYTYTWSPSGGNTTTASGLNAGSYTCNMTDAHGCTKNASVNIIQPNVLNISVIASTSVTCNSFNNGSAAVNTTGGTGPFTYTWTPTGGNGTVASNLPAGSYTCSITDAKGCTKNTVINILQPAALAITSTATPVACSGGANGSASINVAGGINPYTYTWTPTGGNSATALNLPTGTYTCSISDANSCPKKQVVIITDIPPKDSLDILGTLCSNDPTVVLAAPHGGIIPDTIGSPYQWYSTGNPVNGATTSIFTATPANVTNYSVTWFYHGCRYKSTTLLETVYQDISGLPQTNIFTPNDDRVNDDFLPFSLSNATTPITYQQIAAVVEEYELFIYDRWGVLMFHTTQVLDTWDGIQLNGGQATAGTYYWMAKYKTKCNTKNELQNIKGFLQLIR